MLYDRAHPHRKRRTKHEYLVCRFLDGLQDEEVRFEVEYHKEPTTIDEAVYNVLTLMQTRAGFEGERGHKRATRRAVEKDESFCEAQSAPNKQTSYNKTSKWHKRPQPDSTESNDGVLQQILKRLDTLEGRTRSGNGERRSRREVECNRCHGKGHFARECLIDQT
ncbi:hypothetical protein DPMN_006588 [Dreissena polymorpha]|uniref:CCHC-type domain-containing protein n=1 Tax=Dreissena polymorpha TaxID=45954 RepID=A0A9D4RVH9_DREPO|nr:hypothetical protein DPMN_006588 [Dreissena polymorpha]